VSVIALPLGGRRSGRFALLLPWAIGGMSLAALVYFECGAAEYERTGRVSGGVSKTATDFGFPVTGPEHPRLQLAYAALGDPRPGFDYVSLRSGRIVIESTSATPR